MEAAREGVGLRKRCSLRTFTSISGPTHLRRSGLSRPPLACRHPQCGKGCPIPGSKEGPTRSMWSDHATGTGRKRTRGAVVGEAPLRSATEAGVAGAQKVRRMHKADCPPDTQVPVESHPGTRDRAGVPVLSVRMGMEGERAPGSPHVELTDSSPEEPAPKCSAVTLTKRTCMCWGSPRTGSWAVSAALILVRLPCHVQPACVELSQSHFGLKPGQSLGGNLRLQDLSCSGLVPEQSEGGSPSYHPAGHLPCSRRSAICSRGQVWLSGSWLGHTRAAARYRLSPSRFLRGPVDGGCGYQARSEAEPGGPAELFQAPLAPSRWPGA